MPRLSGSLFNVPENINNLLGSGLKMKKRVCITIVTMLALTIASAVVVAKNATLGKKVVIKTFFRMEIFDDGKLSDNKMLVELRIFDDDELYVDWNHVYIDSVHETKTVILKAQYFSTLEGSIKNVKVDKGTFSFTIDLSGTPLSAGRTVQVVGNKRKEGQYGYDVEAIGL